MVGIVLLFVPGSALAGKGEVNFFLGQKALDEDDWAPVEDQGEFGAEMSWAGPEWPVSIATDVLFSADEQDLIDPFFGGTATLTGATSELDVGVRKIWGTKAVRPYLGGGLAIVNAVVEFEEFGLSVDEEETGLGAWFGGGVFWRLGKKFNIGFSARWSGAEVDFGGVDVEAGGTHFGLLLGFGWPAKG
jgi:hypothetical protein